MEFAHSSLSKKVITHFLSKLFTHHKLFATTLKINMTKNSAIMTMIKRLMRTYVQVRV